MGTVFAAADMTMYLLEGDYQSAALSGALFVPGGALLAIGLGVKAGPKILGLARAGAKDLSAALRSSRIVHGLGEAGTAARTALKTVVSKAAKWTQGVKNRVRGGAKVAADVVARPTLREMAAGRRVAVRQAWRDEEALVRRTGEGSRKWKDHEIAELLATGKVKGCQGHHVNSVDWALNNTENPMWWITNPDNISFLTRAEHLAEHGGNFRNWTTGPLIDRRVLP